MRAAGGWRTVWRAAWTRWAAAAPAARRSVRRAVVATATIGVGVGGGVALSELAACEADWHDNLERMLKKAEARQVMTERWQFYSGLEGGELRNMHVFCGSSTPALAQEVCQYLGLRVGKANVGKFADGETRISLEENVRGASVYVIQGSNPPVNDNLVELLLLVSTLRRASAKHITVVIPYFGYARQDRKVAGASVPISAADVATMLDSMGVDRVVALDLHNAQVQGFFGPRVPVVHLSALPVGAALFAERALENPVVVAPSTGSVHRARHFRSAMGHMGVPAGLAFVLLRKPQKLLTTQGQPPAAASTQAQDGTKADLVGNVAGSDCILVDDMIDTASTLSTAAQHLRERGARRVFAFATHGLFSGRALQRLAASELEQVVVTNTIPPLSADDEAGGKVVRLSVAPLLAEALRRIHTHESIAGIYEPQLRQQERE